MPIISLEDAKSFLNNNPTVSYINTLKKDELAVLAGHLNLGPNANMDKASLSKLIQLKLFGIPRR